MPPGTTTLPLQTVGSQQVLLLYLKWQWGVTRYLYLTFTDSREPPGASTLPLLTERKPPGISVLPLQTVGSHQVPLTYLYWQWGATRYFYLTSTDNGEPPGIPTLTTESGEPPGTHTLPLLTMGSHQLSLPYSTGSGEPPGISALPLLTVGSHRYLYLTPTDSGEPPDTTTLSLTMGSYKVSLP